MNKYVVGKPKILNRELFLKRVEDILDTSVYSNIGPYTVQLEETVEEYLKVNNAVAFVNATAAIEAVLTFLRYRVPFGQIMVPSFTFVSAVHSVIRAGYEPLFIDIDDDFCMSPTDAIRKMNPKSVGAVMPANLFGNVCDMHGIYSLGLPIIVDSAHALGIYDSDEMKYVGNFGGAEIFSLHPTKICGSLELGIVTTNNYELYTFLKSYRDFGFEKNTSNPHGTISHIIGTNAKPNEISSAAALCQFENIQEIIEHYFNIFKAYKALLPEWCKLCEPNTFFSNYSYIVCRVHRAYRDDFVKYLIENGIYARTYFQPIHKSAPYAPKYGHISLPNTERLAAEVLCLPTGLTIEYDDVAKICSTIDRFGIVNG